MKREILRLIGVLEDYDGFDQFCDECGCEINGQAILINGMELCEDCAEKYRNDEENTNDNSE